MEHFSPDELLALRYHTLSAFTDHARYPREIIDLPALSDYRDIYIRRMLHYYRWAGLLDKRGATSSTIYSLTAAGHLVVPVFAVLHDDLSDEA